MGMSIKCSFIENHDDDESRDALIEIDRLDAEVIGQLTDFMIGLVDELVSEAGRCKKSMWGIQVSINGMLFSERIIWSIISELPSASEAISCYVAKLCTTWKGTELPWLDEENTWGAHAIREYVVRYPWKVGVIDAFASLIMASDMEHETWQQDAVQMVFSWGPEGDLSRLFFARMFGNPGQSSGEFLDARLRTLCFSLHTNVQLKRLLDHMLNHLPVPVVSQEDYELLVTAACGSDRLRRDVVMQYVVRRLSERNAKLEPGDGRYHYADEIEQLVPIADAMSLQQHYITFDSGFHRRVDLKWIAY